MELYTNNPTTTLNGTINNSVTSVVVNSAATFPATGNFRILIDSEIMLVTSVSGSTFTVARGAEGTTAASHSSGVQVDGIITKGTLDTYRSDNYQYGAYGSLPAAGFAGLSYKASDSQLYARDNGSSWQWFYDGWPITPPVPGDFSWSNQQATTETDANGGILLTVTGSISGLQTKLRASYSTPYTVTALFLVCAGDNNGDSFGLCWQDNLSGKLEACRWLQSTDSGANVYRASLTTYSSPTTGVANNADVGFVIGDLAFRRLWMRIADDGTSHIFSISSDGFNFITIRTSVRTVYLSAGGDHVGFFTNMAVNVPVFLQSWVKT